MALARSCAPENRLVAVAAFGAIASALAAIGRRVFTTAATYAVGIYDANSRTNEVNAEVIPWCVAIVAAVLIRRA